MASFCIRQSDSDPYCMFSFYVYFFLKNCWCVVVVFIGYKKIILMLVTVSWGCVGGGHLCWHKLHYLFSCLRTEILCLCLSLWYSLPTLIIQPTWCQHLLTRSRSASAVLNTLGSVSAVLTRHGHSASVVLTTPCHSASAMLTANTSPWLFSQHSVHHPWRKFVGVWGKRKLVHLLVRAQCCQHFFSPFNTQGS